jgi:excisionase family DNA binding protein
VDIAVREAARRLGVDDSRVRQLLRSRAIGGSQVGREWLVSASDVARLASRRVPAGRPLAPARAWGLLDLLDGGSAQWLAPVARSQVRQVGRRLSGAHADRWRAALRARSEVHLCRAHAAAVRRLLDDPAVRLGGPGEAQRLGIDLVVLSARPEVYVPAPEWPRLARSLHLLAAVDEPDVVVRVPHGVWPLEQQDHAGVALLAADLLDSDEPRAIAAGVARLNELSHTALAPRR